MWDKCPANAAILQRKFPDSVVIDADVRESQRTRDVPDAPAITTVCFMCTPSSTLKRQNPHDHKHWVNDEMLQRAIDVDSQTILIENVMAFLHAGKPAGQHIRRAKRKLRKHGYKVNVYMMNSGVWTGCSRPRCFILGHHFDDDDPLGQLEIEAANLPMKPLRASLQVEALWHPPHNDNFGPKGDVSIISADRCYPCIDTKCLKRPPRPPRTYSMKRGDHAGGFKTCAIPTARTILKLHGLPSTYLTQAEIDQERCTCDICRSNPNVQAGRMLGRCFSATMARKIAAALLPQIESMMYRTEAEVNSMGDFCTDDAHPAARKQWSRTYRSLAARVTRDRRALLKAIGIPTRSYLRRAVISAYVQKQEQITGHDIRKLAPPEVYKLSDIKKSSRLSKATLETIDKSIKTFSDVFAKDSNTLPRPVHE